jgi:hypothetical protein
MEMGRLGTHRGAGRRVNHGEQGGPYDRVTISRQITVVVAMMFS